MKIRPWASILLVIPLGMASGFITGGIPVPGRTVSAVSFFQMYGASCAPSTKRSYTLDQINGVLANIDAENIAAKLFRNLYFAIGDVEVERLMGKWYMVVDSPTVHSEQCSVSYYSLVDNDVYTATFSTRQYSLAGNSTVNYNGYGIKIGPDPGQVLINTGHPADPCPYFPIRLGSVDERGQYSYMILTQPLKHPTVVLARDPLDFELSHRAEVEDFLSRYGFTKPLALLNVNTTVHFTNASACLDAYLFYKNL
ncbi:hypothetical protein QR680_009487 [Steinernema hermaphroditum]|uniref:Lipocalin domain-containing protein n=1 Tax=Steinernema hermaphroditum TaxID=289476 RepID=A0AA39ILR2_9BILA|nr:hypothetical protein QR680_009487 [Steinernema hermaphroditum]